MKVTLESGRALVAPGYLFIQGYWLANQPEEGEDPATYKGYYVDLPASGEVVVAARLDLTRSLIELVTLPKAETYPDCLVLAYVDAGNGTSVDLRQDIELCGVVDALGDLSSKVEYAVNYIDTQIEDRLNEAEAQIAAQNALLDEKIQEVAAEVEKIVPPPVGTVKYTASQDVGPEWLHCDGSFISEDDYPELVEVLGKLTPGIDQVKKYGGEGYTGTFSTSYKSSGFIWVYWFEEEKLLGCVHIRASTTRAT